MMKAIVFAVIVLVALTFGTGEGGRPRRRHQRDRGYRRSEYWTSRHHGRHSLEAYLGSMLHSRQGKEIPDSSSWLGTKRNNLFLSSLFSWVRRESWWEGPNVCEKKTEEVTNATAADQDLVRHYSSNSQTCDESETAYRCKIVERNVKGKREVTITYECCHGYSRAEGDDGCPKKLQMHNLVQTAEDMGLTDFVKALKLLQMTDRLKRDNFTLFVPINGAFGPDSDFIESGPAIMLSDRPSTIIVSDDGIDRTMRLLQGAVLSHVVQGVHKTSSMEDEQILETGSRQGSTIRINYFFRPARLTTANCVPVVSSDNMATNGVVHSIQNTFTPVTDTLLDLVRTRPELSMFKTVLASADYVPRLEEEGKLTLLAPSDGAFMKMDRNLRERLLGGDRKCLERVLLNHLLPHVICTTALQGQAHTYNLLNKYINLTRTEDDELFVEESQIIEADIMGTNGVMHIIDKMLVPDEALGIVDVLVKKGFTELLKLVQIAGLARTMEDLNNVTIFAPSNEAIQAMSEAQKSRLSSDRDMLKKVLLYHVSPTVQNCRHYHNSKLVSSVEGRQIRLNRYTDYLLYKQTRTAQCAPIVGHEFDACNGKIHVISTVMIPPIGNVVDVLGLDKRFSTLISLIKKAGLADALQGDGPFTVFAPNNEAFEKVDRRTLDYLADNMDLLVKVLKDHIFEDTLCCAGITRGSWFDYRVPRTMGGSRLRLSRDRSGTARIWNAQIVKCDRTATNGNVLELDQVLLTEVPQLQRRWRHQRFRPRRDRFMSYK